MTKYLLIASCAVLAITAPALADPDKDESGKGYERAEKADEKAFEARKKFAEKEFEARKKWAEQREKEAEKAFEHQKKFEEKRLEAAKKFAEHEDKAFEKALERREKRIEKAAERQRRAWERPYDPDWEEAYERRARQLELASIGQRIDPNDYGYVPSWSRTRYEDTDDYYYRYDDSGYLYQVNRGNSLISTLIPLLGGGYRVGQMLPVSYADPVPLAYRDMYRDTDDYYYRYGDGGIYQVNAQTGIIESIVALLTGNALGVGNRLPQGYDVYNVPLQYRDRYYDTADSWYRYNDGSIYQVDPKTRLIQAVISAII